MKNLFRFLAVVVFLAVFAVGCGSSGETAKLRRLIQQDTKEAIKPWATRVATLEAAPAPATPDLRPLESRLAAVENGLANLNEGVTVAVQTAVGAKEVANQATDTANASRETAAAGLKKATAADKKATKALALITQGELTPAASTQAKRKYTKVSARDLAEGKGEAELSFKAGSSLIDESQKNGLIALLKARGLKIISIVAVEDRHLKGTSTETQAAALKRQLAEERVQSVKTSFTDWLSASATEEVIPPYGGYSGIVTLLLGKDKP
ncbi:MAG: hypothetical protein Q7R92_05075 [bacterium]|nr:hypothetical protein [bacterium]